MMKKIYVLLIALFVSVIEVFAVQAYPHLITFTQPDESTLSIYLKGDEKVHWAETEDGYSLLYNDNGYLVYAILDEKGNMVPSDIIAASKENRKAEVEAFLSKVPRHLHYNDSQIADLLSIWEMVENQKSQKAEAITTGKVKLLLILMSFSDQAFTKTAAEVRALFNQVNYRVGGATGSVRDYYRENSYGKLDLEFDVVGPYTTTRNTSYYGNTSNGYQNFVREAVNAAAADVDYSDYDNNHDGDLDGFHILFAGYGEESTGNAAQIWSHKSVVYPAITHNSTRITTYSCSPELRGSYGSNLTNIGVVCHELGHVFGAPDYYDTDYSSSGGDFPGTGEWDMMASGCWNDNGRTPSHHNPFTKIFIYKWADVIDLEDPCSVVMKASALSPDHFYRYYTTTPNEYFLLENRQLVGFDADVPGRGLLIYHVHPSIASSFNGNTVNTRHPQKFYPVCASSSYSVPTSSVSSYGVVNSGGCTFPGSRSKTTFADNTTPASLSWAGNNTEKPLTNIKNNLSHKTLSFVFNGGSENPSNFVAAPNSESSIRLSWMLYATYQVMVVYSTDSIFGVPDSINYEVGQEIDGGGTVLYVGSDTTFIHEGLGAEETYYYKVYSKIDDKPTWSTGIVTWATTPCNRISTFPYTESFEGEGIPTCWNMETTLDTVIWEEETGANLAPKVGDKCLYAHIYSFENGSETVRLETAPFDFSQLSEANVSFWYTLRKRVGKQDSLTVLYKNSFASEWTVLETYSSGAESWTKDTIALPDLTNYYQLAFEATLLYGNGIALDNMIFFEKSEVLGIGDVIDENMPSVKLYPNPTNKDVFVSVENPSEGSIECVVYDMMGRKLHSQTLDGSGVNKLDVKGLKPGTYMVKFLSEMFENTELLIVR